MHFDGAFAGIGGIEGFRISGSWRFSFSHAPRLMQDENN
jgi:hypothetical protein